jgi:hypothetical protein
VIHFNFMTPQEFALVELDNAQAAARAGFAPEAVEELGNVIAFADAVQVPRPDVADRLGLV